MFDYLCVLISVVMIGFQFSLTKLYRGRAGTGLLSALLFNTAAGMISAFFFFCLNGFRISAGAYTIITALLLAAALFACNCLSIKAVGCGRMSVYSLFMMLGGMLLPFLYGVLFLNERVGVFRWLALALLIAALVVPCLERDRNKRSGQFVALCIGVFLLNGAVSVISKAHQVSPQASSTYDFLIMTYLFQFGFGSIACAIAAICRRGKKELPPGEEKTVKEGGGKAALILLAVVVAYALDSSVGYMLQLSGAKTLPAVLLYPLITGGTVVVSALFGRLFFKEKITKYVWIGLAVTVIATCLFLI